MPAAQAQIPTGEAGRLIRRPGTYRGHKFPVEFDQQRGRIAFEATTATLWAGAETLLAQLEAADGAHPAQMQAVVAEHLQRMARGRSRLRIEWTRRAADAR